MTINARQDSSYLFSGLNSTRTNTSYGISGLASLVSDYNTIKNGSYNKLVSAYYKKMGSDSTSSSSTSSATSAKKTASHSDYLDNLLGFGDKMESTDSASSSSGTASAKTYSQIASDAADVKSSLSALSSGATSNNLYREKYVTTKDEEGNETSTWGVDRDAIGTAVSKFVDSYNALLKSSADADSTTVSSRASSLSRLASSFSSQLKEIGITYDDKGALSLDKDKLASADVNAIKSVFNDVGSFGDRTDSISTMIKSGATTAASNASTYSASGTSSVNYSSFFSSAV